MPNPGPATNIVSNSMAELITVSQPARYIYPQDQLTAVTAPGNGTMSFQYVNVPQAFTASRVDALVAFSVASSATTNTYGLAITAIGGIYSTTALGSGTATTAGLTALTTGSATVSYSVASNTAGVTQLNQSALRNISVPLGFATVYAGEYIVGLAISTNTSSVGLSTTALGQTLSIYGGNQLQTAQNYAVEFTQATATSVGLFAGMGVHSVSQSFPLNTYAISDINATGSAASAANIALVFRNV
jgi:hypothetical protein